MLSVRNHAGHIQLFSMYASGSTVILPIATLCGTSIRSHWLVILVCPTSIYLLLRLSLTCKRSAGFLVTSQIQKITLN